MATRKLTLAAIAIAAVFGAKPASAQDDMPRISLFTEVTRGARQEWNRLNGFFEEALRREDYNEALELATRALAQAEAGFNPDEDPIPESMERVATAYELLGRFSEAEQLRVRALRARERALGMDHRQTLNTVIDLAAFYDRHDREAEAEPLFIRAVDSFARTRGQDDDYTLGAVEALATLYFGQGRFAEAEPLITRNVQISQRRFGPPTVMALSPLANLAALYLADRRYALAEPLLTRILATIEASHPELQRRSANIARMTRSNLASLYANQGRYDEAVPLDVRVLEESERNLGREHPDTLRAAMDLALSYTYLRRYSEAEALYGRALEAFQRIRGNEDSRTVGAAWGLAWSRLSSPAPASALGPARLAMAGSRVRRDLGQSNLFGEAQRNREEDQGSLAPLILADAAWANIGTRGADRGALAEEALAALQIGTAGSTNRAVIQTAIRRLADNQSATLGALVRERAALNDQWAANDRRYAAILAGANPGAAPMRQAVVDERARIEQRMTAIDGVLRRDFPQYFALVRPEPVDLAAAQAMLAPDEAMLMVVPTRFGTHLMVLGQRGPLHWVRSDWTRTEVDRAVGQMLSGIRRTMSGGAYSYDRQSAFQLYNQVVAPVAQHLAGRRHVFVVAAGSLSTIPFGVLVTEAPQGADSDPQALRDTRWFADAHALTAIPSIQSLRFLRQQGRPSPSPGSAPGFLGFGNPSLAGRSESCGRGGNAMPSDMSALASGRRNRSGGMLANVSLIRTLCPLPGTATELENMRTALRAPEASVLTGARATERNIRTMDLSGARILVLATHGLVAGELSRSAEPGLIFTPPATATEDDDGYLTASEVAALHLNADWVILSACNTAAGDGSTGAPGLSGLVRAFFYAGARNLLASHWPVADDAGARLTVRTIQLMQEHPGIRRAEGLQRAMREIRESPEHPEWAHPGVWAPFSLIGDGAH
jgi:CHAT domain-containing protein/tetratricopeptide (TPR) repeat protein